jgi:ubiquinone/menaquinone biosynthesis C-methylase UbiE
MPTSDEQLEHQQRVVSYYSHKESLWGYKLLLGGTKHFGLYPDGGFRWNFDKAMRAMEYSLWEALNLPETSKVLDAGCGMGDVSRYLSSNFQVHVTGVDLLEFNVLEARKRAEVEGLSAKTEYVVGDYTHTGIDTDSLDGVYTLETLVHCADVENALKEFYRVIKPGGRVVLTEYDRKLDEEISPEAARAFMIVNELAGMPAFQHEFVNGRLVSLLEAAGFEDVTVEDLTEQMMPMLKAFKTLARLPYFIARSTGQQRHAVNSMSAVEFYKHRGAWRYLRISGTKPLHPGYTLGEGTLFGG